MLKIFSINNLREDNPNIDPNLFNVNLSSGLFKFYDKNHERIVYDGENEAALEKLIGASLTDEMGIDRWFVDELPVWIKDCDGGEYIQVDIPFCVDGMQIGMEDCVSRLQDEWEDYEQRIFEAEISDEEVEKILTSFLPVFLSEALDEIKSNITAKIEECDQEIQWL